MLIEALLTDFGNVLAEVRRSRTCALLADLSGLTDGDVCERIYGPELEYASETGQLDLDGHHAAVSEALELGDELPQEAFVQAYWEGLSLIPESVAALKSLRRADMPVYVFSNISPVHKEWFLSCAELEGSYDKAFFSCDMGVMKPDARAFRLVAERIGGSPERTLFLDDRKENCEAGRQAGFVAELVTNSATQVPGILGGLLGKLERE